MLMYLHFRAFSQYDINKMFDTDGRGRTDTPEGTRF